jgi:hypothetical protein
MRNFNLNATAVRNANVDRAIRADRRTVVADAIMAGGAGEMRSQRAQTSHERHAPQDFTSKRGALALLAPGSLRLSSAHARPATAADQVRPSCRWRPRYQRPSYQAGAGSRGGSPLAARTRG